MSNSTLVIISGPPGAGKTTLGRRLAKDLSLPFIGKDDFKEILFDTLGVHDREWSIRLGVASVELIFHMLEREVEASRSAVIESAFVPQYDRARFVTLRQRFRFESLQLYCGGEPDVLAARFLARDHSGERHPGHIVPGSRPDDLVAILKSDKYGILDIGGSLLQLDTTDFEAVDYATILAWVRAGLDRWAPRSFDTDNRRRDGT